MPTPLDDNTPAWRRAPATGWPTASEVARAIVAASQIVGEDPLDVAGGQMGSRARWYAFAVLSERFPDVYYRKFAQWVGFAAPRSVENSRSLLAHNLRNNGWRWWSNSELAAVRAALLAEVARTEAAINENVNAIIDAGLAPPINPEREARVERMKAWADGDPIDPPLDGGSSMGMAEEE